MNLFSMYASYQRAEAGHLNVEIAIESNLANIFLPESKTIIHVFTSTKRVEITLEAGDVTAAIAERSQLIMRPLPDH